MVMCIPTQMISHVQPLPTIKYNTRLTPAKETQKQSLLMLTRKNSSFPGHQNCIIAPKLERTKIVQPKITRDSHRVKTTQ